MKKFAQRNFNNAIDIFYMVIIGISIVALIINITLLGMILWSAYHDVEVGHLVDSAINVLHTQEWDWIAVTIACISLFFASVTFYSQRKTEKNTMKITPESQRQILKDLIRHYYRNLIIITAVENKINNRYDELYPSEEHLLKLAVCLEDLHPAAFYNQAAHYQEIHNLTAKMRNFNIELDTATKHLCSAVIPAQIKKHDFATLKFKMSFLAKETFGTIEKIWSNRSQNIRKLLNNKDKDQNGPANSGANFNEVRDMLLSAAMSYNSADLAKLNDKLRNKEIDLNCIPSDGEKNFFVNFFSGDDLTRKKFVDLTNKQIYIEMTARSNPDDPYSEKLTLIPFPKDKTNNII
ncbi:MAG: hypothetical protein K2M11_09025 [Paramuribaculum sp.]|nr:hypothetical protein [Paramuribaculum sp.]